ncbi:Quercetin 2,3-dioxygenase [Bdellovibrio bacteriovorus]|uniref:pirin family protein n=1 Tax=Bdellovibrio bacteriovorus TaxID=959 RepID=UPI00068EB713|nr:pirin family protein [Bdellovibrio bacteriovorus]BEV69841.1 Quercetin 2,3-dioxygenase [Bdellovibrio bacteriovorus]
MKRRDFVRSISLSALGALLPLKVFASDNNKARVTLRPSGERGSADHGWLKTKHSFSFANYRDPKHMGFKNLRVINQDIVVPLEGFPTHPHTDMEIVTYVLSGEVKHKDTLGNSTIIKRGEIQKMTAGTGIQHSEYNSSSLQDVHFLQIWIEPSLEGVQPIYEQKAIDGFGKEGLICVASEAARKGGLYLNAKADIFRGKFSEKTSTTYRSSREGSVWIQVISGSVSVGKVQAQAGDGVRIERGNKLNLQAGAGTEFLLFDLA